MRREAVSAGSRLRTTGHFLKSKLTAAALCLDGSTNLSALSPVDAEEDAPHQRAETLEIAVVASAAASAAGPRPTASV